MSLRADHLHNLSLLQCPALHHAWNVITGLNIPPPVNEAQARQHPILKATDGPEKQRIHDQLRGGNWNEAWAIFRTMADRESYSMTRLAMSIVFKDRQHPHTCVPLWDASWNLDRRIKQAIIDTFLAVANMPLQDPSGILGPLKKLTYGDQIQARILIALGRRSGYEKFNMLRGLSVRYFAAACWNMLNMEDPKVGRSNAVHLLNRLIQRNNMTDTKPEETISVEDFQRAEHALELVQVQSQKCPIERGVLITEVPMHFRLAYIFHPCLEPGYWVP